MPPIRALYNTILDALFPVPKAEEELSSLTPETAFEVLPRAPAYTGLAVSLPEARSIFAYKDERVSKLVWSLKYKRSARAAALGGYALWRELCAGAVVMCVPVKIHLPTGQTGPINHSASSFEFSPEHTSLPLHAIIISMPITPRRRRERGFNQCELLVDEIERLDKDGRFAIEKNLLMRVRHASRQTLKGRTDRLSSAKGVFAVNGEAAARLRSSPRFEEMSIVVIDDVITTGSTMREALDALKKAGFAKISGLSLAH
jgi:ComF family protein